MTQAAKVIVIPDEPRFSFSDVVAILKAPKATVNYWKENGKLPMKQDFRGKEYIERQDLRLFVTDYLKLQVSD